MSQNSKAQANQIHGDSRKSDQTVEVLYQKMGDRWFAFSLINDEVFVGSISQEDLAAAERNGSPENPSARTYKISGNS